MFCELLCDLKKYVVLLQPIRDTLLTLRWSNKDNIARKMHTFQDKKLFELECCGKLGICPVLQITLFEVYYQMLTLLPSSF